MADDGRSGAHGAGNVHKIIGLLAQANAAGIGLEPGKNAKREIDRRGVQEIFLGAGAGPNDVRAQLTGVGQLRIETSSIAGRYEYFGGLKPSSASQSHKKEIHFAAVAVAAMQDRKSVV